MFGQPADMEMDQRKHWKAAGTGTALIIHLQELVKWFGLFRGSVWVSSALVDALTCGMKISEQTVHLLTGNGQVLLPPARSQSPWVQSSWRSSLQKRRGTDNQLVLVQTEHGLEEETELLKFYLLIVLFIIPILQVYT